VKEVKISSFSCRSQHIIIHSHIC